MRELVKDGKIELKIPFVIKSIKGDSSFEGVELMHFETKEDEILECDEALFFFGLNKQLGQVACSNQRKIVLHRILRFHLL